MPIVILIDTTTNTYHLKLGIATASIEGHEQEMFRVKLRVMPFRLYFYPLRKWKLAKRKKAIKKNVRRYKKRNRLKQSLRILRSFTLEKLHVDLDTGDYILNAQLYPAFTFINQFSGGVHVNFKGRRQVIIKVRNRPIHIIRSIINL